MPSNEIHTASEEYDFRIITFNGVELPLPMMGSSILINYFGDKDERGDWLLRLRHCCGLKKQASSDLTNRSCEFLRDLLLEKRAEIITEIQERLPLYPAASVYAAWMQGFTQILEVADLADPCVWSAASKSTDTELGPKNIASWLRYFGGDGTDK